MRELKNYNIKNFPVDEYMFENQCSCCGKGISEGYKLYLRDEYCACSEKCFHDILYYSGHYMWTSFDEGDYDVSKGDCVFESDGNAYWNYKYLKYKEDNPYYLNNYYDEDEEHMNS